MEIRARSVYTEETMKKFSATTMKSILLTKFIIIDIVYTLLLLLLTRSIVFALVFMVIMTILIIWTYVATIKKQFKMTGKFQGTVNYYLFRDNDFTCSSTTLDGGYHDDAVINYSFPIKAIETADYLYIYTQKNRAFIIDKRTIENGTIDNIRCKLMPLLGKNYKITK